MQALRALTVLALALSLGCGPSGSPAKDGPAPKDSKDASTKDASAKGKDDSSKLLKVTAEQLAAECKADKAAAEAKYNIKTLEIEGIISDAAIGNFFADHQTVQLKGAPGMKVQARLNGKPLKEVKVGQIIKFKGVLGFVTDGVMNLNEGEFISLAPGK
jgi:hypothetical protein